MASEKSLTIAEQINSDLNEAKYYEDTEILCDFLKGKFSASDLHKKAKEAAIFINEDRRGAHFYKDSNLLAEYLDGKFE